MRCLGSVFVKAYQVARLLYTDSVTLRHFLASVEVEICASPLALVFLDFVVFFLSQKSALFCGAFFVDATGGKFLPHHFVASASIGYSGEEERELLSFFR